MDKDEIILAGWKTLLDRQSAMQARIDVLLVVMGNVLPAFHKDTQTIARVQAALEVFGEVASTKSEPYRDAAAEEIARYLRDLPRD